MNDESRWPVHPRPGDDGWSAHSGGTHVRKSLLESSLLQIPRMTGSGVGAFLRIASSDRAGSHLI